MAAPPFNLRRYPDLCTVLGEEVLDPGSRSLADDAYDRILLGIIRGDLAPGAELKTTRLADDLGMSRTPVIQALARLAADGIVGQSLNQRASVRPGAENWLVDLHRTRQLIEPEAARAAAGNLPSGVVADLQRLAEDAKPGRGGDWQAAVRWFDQSLHLAIAEYCGNLSIRELVRRCWSYKRLSYEAGNDSDAHLREGWREHSEILAALASGDGDRAAVAMGEHLSSAVRDRGAGRIV